MKGIWALVLVLMVVFYAFVFSGRDVIEITETEYKELEVAAGHLPYMKGYFLSFLKDDDVISRDEYLEIMATYRNEYEHGGVPLPKSYWAKYNE